MHDPSVVVADGRFYVFGSHLAAARSRDLQRWTSVADLVTPENPLFEDVTVELAEAFAAARPEKNLELDFVNPEDGRSFSPVASLGLDSRRLTDVGWDAATPLAEGVSRTIRSFEDGPLVRR